ncbi:helix-turn-helix transcriptional regulator [Marinobacter confluentis]|uniref:DNA-binding protein n=1 Tax=Marinobacter confluentis TaxID=1697557 RepID=A0A4Z1C9S0_9GAMM|nr:DNA-binding protein [Marinobacter confluentis]TGN40373.1 DNA-binding protein [Marinobacter confluentis]
MKVTSDFDFTLTFAVPELIDSETLEARLFEAGCDDAIIGLGQKGRLALNLSREAESAEAALMTALRDVKMAVPEAKLVEAGPDLVGISEMARLLAFSRQNMRKLIQTNLASFPLPIHEGAAGIWHLADVLSWFSDRQKRDIPHDLMSVAQVAMSVNLAREADRVDPGVSAQLKDIA